MAVSMSVAQTTDPSKNLSTKKQGNEGMPEILHLIKIRSPQEKVFEALSMAQGVQQWWTRDASLEPKAGSTGDFGFYGRRNVINVKVEKLSPAHIAWGDVTSTGGAFDGTNIAFDLKSQDGVTSVLFSHRGFKASGENVASATTRWGFYLLSLKRYLETGKGTPNPEDVELIR
jgi:uncharacterized protein YndB with AHSA1/START domain